MKLTKKSVKHEVETTEIVCELTKDEFEQTCADAVASTIFEFMGDDFSITAAIALTDLLAKFSHNLEKAMFNEPTTNDTKEEQ